VDPRSARQWSSEAAGSSDSNNGSRLQKSTKENKIKYLTN